jgi:nucleoside-diphosphate-sugar epimerase
VRVLITGAAGFVGSHIVRRFLGAGCEVAALVRPGAHCGRLADVRDRLTIIECDLHSPHLASAVDAEGPELCVHAAWRVPPATYLNAPENLSSVAASTLLLLALKPTRCRRIVFVGSCAEYAPSDTCLDEASAIGPVSLYGTCKHAVSLTFDQFARQYGWSSVTARVFNPYGPHEPPGRLVPSLIGALLHGRSCPLTAGDQVRDFLQVEDVADAIWTVAAGDLQGPVNIASAIPTTVADVAREVARQIGRPELVELGALARPHGDPQWLCARPGRLRQFHSWAPRHDLASGLEATIRWWRRQLSESDGVSTLSGRAN